MDVISTLLTRRIYIADDHPLILESFCNIFSELDPMFIVSKFSEYSELENALSNGAAPDLVLIDFGMPGFGSIDTISKFLRSHSACLVAVFSGHVDSKLATDIIQLGCRGYIPKTLSPKAVYHAVLLMIEGGIFLPDFITTLSQVASSKVMQDCTETFVSEKQKYNFTSREVDVLIALTRGLQNKEIALELNLAEATVKIHLRHAFSKLKVCNRVGAVLAVMEGALNK